jgi:acetylornithine/succinyldiaminopimelate/putrescine aminotransferase
VRGKGLLNAIVIHEDEKQPEKAWQICLKLKDAGLLAKQTHRHVVRLAPPLCITAEQVSVLCLFATTITAAAADCAIFILRVPYILHKSTTVCTHSKARYCY